MAAEEMMIRSRGTSNLPSPANVHLDSLRMDVLGKKRCIVGQLSGRVQKTTTYLCQLTENHHGHTNGLHDGGVRLPDAIKPSTPGKIGCSYGGHALTNVHGKKRCVVITEKLPSCRD